LWATEKLNFKVQKPTNFRYDFKGNLTFNFNFAFKNFLPTSIDVTSLVIKVFQNTGLDENNVMLWQLLAEQKPHISTTTITIDKGTQSKSIAMQVPITTSASSLMSAISNRFLKGQKQTFKIQAFAVIEGQKNRPIREEVIFEI
jgi:hypothetical protein